MCSPVGHSLVALAMGISRYRPALNWQYIAFIVISGNAADMDFIVGWFLDDINAYHRLGSHSITAGLIYGVLVYYASRFHLTTGINKSTTTPTGWAMTGAMIYLSHSLLDLLSLDQSIPIGIQLFWPFSDQFVIAPITIFRSFLHETVGNNMWEMISGLLNTHNLVTVVVEIVIFLPILLFGIGHRNQTREKIGR